MAKAKKSAKRAAKVKAKGPDKTKAKAPAKAKVAGKTKAKVLAKAEGSGKTKAKAPAKADGAGKTKAKAPANAKSTIKATRPSKAKLKPDAATVGRREVKIQRIDHVAITVSDIGRSIEWYTSVLGLEHRPIVEWGEYPQMVCAGETCLALFPPSGSGAEPMSSDEKSSRLTMRHFAFAVDRENFGLAQERFREMAIEFEFADHGVCHSVYVSDPDGHRVEITTWEI